MSQPKTKTPTFTLPEPNVNQLVLIERNDTARADVTRKAAQVWEAITHPEIISAVTNAMTPEDFAAVLSACQYRQPSSRDHEAILQAQAGNKVLAELKRMYARDNPPPPGFSVERWPEIMEIPEFIPRLVSLFVNVGSVYARSKFDLPLFQIFARTDDGIGFTQMAAQHFSSRAGDVYASQAEADVLNEVQQAYDAITELESKYGIILIPQPNGIPAQREDGTRPGHRLKVVPAALFRFIEGKN